MQQPLRVVGPDQKSKSINLAHFPASAPGGAIASHLYSTEVWEWSADGVALHPLSSAKLEESVRLYESMNPGNDNVAMWYMDHQSNIPEEWAAFEIYFLGTTHVLAPWVKFARALHKEGGHWKLSLRRLDRPPVQNSKVLLLK